MRDYVPQDFLPQLPFFLGLSVLAIFIAYWIFIYYFQADHSENDKIIIYFAIFSVFMFFWSFRKAVCTEPGYVPKGNIESNDEQLAGLSDQEKRERRYCVTCKLFKPERVHHCSQCQRCVLNMDHHCIWTANCVGLMNRKYFNLVLQWGTISLLLGAFFGSRYAYRTIEDILYETENERWVWMIFHCFCLLIIVAGLSNLIGLMIFMLTHLNYILKNITTLDSIKGSKTSQYSFGKIENYKFYFGKNPLLWLVPVGKPLGDGYRWNKNHKLEEEEERSL
ncbi:hypothetical protein ABPG72_021681 [Tetrahymena utriculariae]